MYPITQLFLLTLLPLAHPLISCQEACTSCDDEAIPSILREVHCSMCEECHARTKGRRQEIVPVFPPGCPTPPLCQPMYYCPPYCVEPTPAPKPEKLINIVPMTEETPPIQEREETPPILEPRPTLGPSTPKAREKMTIPPLQPMMPCCMPMCPMPCYPWPLTEHEKPATNKLSLIEDATESSNVTEKDYYYVYVGVEKQKLRNLRRLNPS